MEQQLKVELRERIVAHFFMEVVDLKLKASEGKEENYQIGLQICKNIITRLEELEQGRVSEITRKIYS